MIVLIITGLLALLCVYLAQQGKAKYGLQAGFLIVTIIAAIHYDYGADYWAYYDYFYDWNRSYTFRLEYSYLFDIFRDVGWVALCLICKPIGFFGMVIVLSVLQNYIYYSFIKQYVNKNYWVLAVFLYLFTIDLYPMNMSMMRQGLAVALFVWALPLVLKHKWIPAILLLLLAASVHTTAIILFPFLILGIWPMKSGKQLGIILLIVFTLLFIYRESIGFLLSPLDYFDNISEKLARSENEYGQLDSFGLGFVIKSIPFLIGIWYLWNCKQWDSIRSPMVAVATFGYLFIPLSAQVYMLQRLYIFFQALTIMTIPLTYTEIRNRALRISLFGILILMTIYEYWSFMNADLYKSTFYTYHTIFEAL